MPSSTSGVTPVSFWRVLLKLILLQPLVITLSTTNSMLTFDFARYGRSTLAVSFSRRLWNVLPYVFLLYVDEEVRLAALNAYRSSWSTGYHGLVGPR